MDQQNAAYVWADTEFYLSPHVEPGPGETPGQPLGHHLKLFVNERAGFAAAGAGTLVGNRLIKAAAEFATSFDEFISGLPNLLKDQAGWLAGSPPWTCIAAGWSRRIGRILGVLFEAPHFRPQYSAQGFARPYRREFEALYPGDAADVPASCASADAPHSKKPPASGRGLAHSRQGEARRDFAECIRPVDRAAPFDSSRQSGRGRRAGLDEFFFAAGAPRRSSRAAIWGSLQGRPGERPAGGSVEGRRRESRQVGCVAFGCVNLRRLLQARRP